MPLIYPDEVIDPPEVPEGAGDLFEGEVVGSSAGQTLADWTATVRRGARATYGKQTQMIGGPFYRVDQMSALVMLLVRLKLGASALRWVLARRPDLLEALGCKRIPPRTQLAAAEAFARDMLAKVRAANREPTAEPEPPAAAA